MLTVPTAPTRVAEESAIVDNSRMSQFPSISGSTLIKALSKLGFTVSRVKGSHHRLEHPDGRKTTVPVHGKETLGPGILLKILRDLDLTRDDLLSLL